MGSPSFRQRWTFTGSIVYLDPWSHELKHFDRQSNRHRVTWECEQRSWDLCGRRERNIDNWWMHRDNSNTNRSLGDKQRLHLPTLMHELIQDVITVFTRLQIVNHTPQTCFQQPALRGWTGALRCGQGQSDVSRKNWCLMGVWKWIKFGVPDT